MSELFKLHCGITILGLSNYNDFAHLLSHIHFKMKKFFIIPLAGVMAVTACTDDAPVIDLPGEGGDVKGYVALSIMAENDYGSRADGDDTGNASRAFVDASAEESYVSHVDLYFFNDDGVQVRDHQRLLHKDADPSSGLEWNEVPGRPGTVQIKGSSLVYPVTANFFTNVIAIANYDAFPREYSKNDILAQQCNFYGVLAVDEPVQNMSRFNAPAKGEYIMSSSVYKKDGVLHAGTHISTAYYQTTTTAAANDPVPVYIERLLSKVTINPNGFDGGNKVQTGLTADVTAGFSPADVTVNIRNWWVSNIPVNAYVIKGHKKAWVNDNNVNGTNAQGTRSYWADPWSDGAWVKQSSYHLPWTNRGHVHDGMPYHGEPGTPEMDLLNGRGIASFYNFPAIVDYEDMRSAYNPGEYYQRRIWNFDQAIYMPENTTTPAENRSSICLLAQIKIGDQVYDIVKWAGKFYKEADYRALLASMLNSMGYRIYGRNFTADDMVGKWLSDPSVSGKDLINMTGYPYLNSNMGQGLHALLVARAEAISDAGMDPYRIKPWENTLVFTNEMSISKVDPNTGATVSADARAELNLLMMTERWRVWYFHRGYTYYFRNIESGINDDAYRYGTVRNHWYELTVNTIRGLGTPIACPVDVIVPVRPSDDQYYIEATTRFLPWRYQYNRINLED